VAEVLEHLLRNPEALSLSPSIKGGRERGRKGGREEGRERKRKEKTREKKEEERKTQGVGAMPVILATQEVEIRRIASVRIS
jgi:ribosomal protein L12E/L44/L45/RPP1/RPP2